MITTVSCTLTAYYSDRRSQYRAKGGIGERIESSPVGASKLCLVTSCLRKISTLLATSLS
jgi:hypothetical protein